MRTSTRPRHVNLWKAAVAVWAATALACEPGPRGPSGPSHDPTPAPTNRAFTGCYAAGAQSSSVGCGLRASFGDPAADAAFASEVSVQRFFWQGIPATVGFFDECRPENRNALAMPNGTILYGVHLFATLYQRYGNGLPIAGVLAHEWAHQVQFRFGWQNHNAPTVRRTELEADAFAGYYMALAKGWAWGSIGSYFQAVAASGDYSFNDRNHHGTPDERLAAARMGFEAGLYAMSYNRPFSYAELHNVFAGAIAANFSREEFAMQASSAAQTDEQGLAASLLAGDTWDVAAGTSAGRHLPLPNLGSTDRTRLFPR